MHSVSSTESKAITSAQQDSKPGVLKIVLDHTPEEEKEAKVRFRLDIWSRNKPALLVRHTTSNQSRDVIEDVRVYLIVDFDVGGPTSYKDDVAQYEPDSGRMLVHDETPLWVSLSSRPRADGHEIASPTKLRPDGETRDLSNNLEAGPRDIAIALQWNLGNLEPGESKSVDIVIASATASDEVKEITDEMWQVFDKKIR